MFSGTKLVRIIQEAQEKYCYADEIIKNVKGIGANNVTYLQSFLDAMKPKEHHPVPVVSSKTESKTKNHELYPNLPLIFRLVNKNEK